MRVVATFDCFVLDLIGYVLYKNGVRVSARRNEIRMLMYLVEQAPRVVSIRELHESVMGYSYDRVDVENIGNSARVQLSRLRAQLRPYAPIETVEGGYRFNGEVQVTAADLPPGSRVERDGRTVYFF